MTELTGTASGAERKRFGESFCCRVRGLLPSIAVKNGGVRLR